MVAAVVTSLLVAAVETTKDRCIMKKVYITNTGGHNFSSAEDFGVLVPLTRGNINPVQTDRLIVDMLEELKDSSADDYLLISGHPVTVAVASSILFSLHGVVNMLIWNKHSFSYNVRSISSKQVKGTIKMNYGGRNDTE
jgi:hypothetical protein